MKRTRSIVMFGLIALVCACISFGACSSVITYKISVDSSKSLVLEVGDEVDYTQYFIVTDNNGNRIVVTEDMLDLSAADTSKAGSFEVTISVGNSTATASFTVVEKTPDPTPDPDPDPNPADIAAFREAAAKYADISAWNFAVNYSDYYDGFYEEYYEYLGYNVLNTYTATDGNVYTDYLEYDEAADTYYFYADLGGSYEKYSEGTAEFEEYADMLYLIDLSEIGSFAFSVEDGVFVADDPSAAGNAIFGEYSYYSWARVEVTVEGGEIVDVLGVMNDGYICKYELFDHGKVDFTLPQVDTPSEPTGTMEKQNYDSATFDDENLQDKLMRTDGAIGLPSTGDVNALVIPVQLKGDTITQAELNKLDAAFNGTSEETGWESVSSYYQKASYGKLNLSFDIQAVYAAEHNADYYLNYSRICREDGYSYTQTGEEVILMEALSYYESRLNLDKYDTNGDGAIDAVYLIYSASVDYSADSDLYWAFTTWYYGSQQYDGLDAFYYFFAGFDFMDESTPSDDFSGYDIIPGIKINASTYIHETGHLLGLDDYYDYEPDQGCNEGLGGADMMDYNVGDHSVYSKIMLGWLEPTIVNATGSFTIDCSVNNASALLIPLKFDNSYFCEYLLIDLYSAEGLNALHASVDSSILYGGASFGVRIYHISSSISDPYNNDFGSFTDNNNSITSVPLIKLVEADGERRFDSSDGFAARSDLWQAGDKLSDAFPAYTRNDGKMVNFDIQIVSVLASSATITVTFD